MGEQHTVCNAQDNDSFALGNHTKLPKKTNNCINKLHRPLAPPRGRPYVDACATAQQEARPMRGLGSAVGWVRPGRLEIRVQAAELGEQSGSLRLGCVVRLVGSEETPQGVS